jgi:predicted DsbA family dithiol-disulfide isomerase
MYRAYFVDGLNVALIDNLMTIVRQLCLTEDEALDVLKARRFREAVDADWGRCRSLGVTAVPTFVVGNKGIVGAQPYEALEKLAVEGGAVKR